MRSFNHKLIAAIFASAFSLQAFAECNLPATPIIPDGNVASMDELVSAQKAMKMYQDSLGSYRECLKEMETAIDATAEDAQDQASAILTSYNSSVDAEAAVAEEFNSAVRVYKSRQSPE